MSDAILVAIITASATVICQLIISAKTKRDQATQQALRDKDFEDRLKHIEDRLVAHNNYAEKISSLVLDITAIKKDLEYLKQK